MGLAITEDRMSSKDTPHTAIRQDDGCWVVSWLPGRRLTRDKAITAMTLAWNVAIDASVCGSNWPYIAADAAELGLKGTDAVKMVTGEGERADAADEYRR